MKKYSEKKNEIIAKNIIHLIKNIDKSENQHRTWFGKGGIKGLPYNLISERYYTSVNILSLLGYMSQRGFTHPYFLTYNQLNKLDKLDNNGNVIYKNGQPLKGHVLKGESAFPVICTLSFWYINNEKTTYKVVKEMFDKQNENWNNFKDNNNIRFYKSVKYYNVFNIEQTNLVGQYYECKKVKHNKTSLDDKVESIVNNLKANKSLEINIIESSNAYYEMNSDIIKLPVKEQFEKVNDYYAILFHELAHWTGHKKRLNRETLINRSKENYALEELTAELTAVLLCAEFGFDKSIQNESANYLKTWCAKLDEEPNIINDLMIESNKAKNYILN